MLLSTLNIVFSVLLAVKADANGVLTPWSGWGGNSLNNRWASDNTVISSKNILSASSHCNMSYPIGVSATPVISEDMVYFPTWNGSFVALNFHSCAVLWIINVSSIIENYAPISPFQAGHTRPISRTSPQIDGNVVYFGTLTCALIVAVNKVNGKTLGIVQLDNNPVAIITMSPTFYDGKLFVGTSSVETSATKLPGYKCCTFVGNMVALKFEIATGTFQVMWRVASIPEYRHKEGWAGGAFWGSQPPIDAGRRQLYIGTGQSYSSSNESVQCQRSRVPPEIPYALNNDTCLPSDVWQVSVLAIDIDSGHVNWVHQYPGVDVFNAACGNPTFGSTQNLTLCPAVPGPDSDFGMAPVYVPMSHGQDRVILGRKNGDLYSLSAEDGHIMWTATTGPVGVAGGLSWGVAVDDTRVYYTVINSEYKNFQLQPSGQTVNRSAYGAASLSDGKILWQTPVPMNGVSVGPPMIVGDLVLVARTGQDPAGSFAYDQTQGGLVALDKVSGTLIKDFMLTTNFHGGVAVDGLYILFGIGYDGFGAATAVPGGFLGFKVGN